MDALAIRRRAAGLPAQSLAWGLWQRTSGLTGHLNDQDRGRLARVGLLPMPTEDGLALFDAAVADGGVTLVTAALNMNSQDSATSPLLQGLGRPRRRVVTDGASAASTPESLSSRLAGLAVPEQTSALVTIIRSHAASVLGHAGPEAVGRDRPFKELGVDSLTAVELRNRVGAATGLRLPPTVVFDHPSPRRLAEHLISLITSESESEPTSDTSAAPNQAVRSRAFVTVATEEQVDDMDIEALVAMVNTGPAGGEVKS
jgi:acyl carrier protein